METRTSSAAHALRTAARDGIVLNVLGLPHSVLVSRADTGGGYELVEITGDPGLGVPPHMHEHEDETFYVLDGRVAFTVEGEERMAEPGTAVHLPRGVPHGFRIAGDAPARMLLVIAPGGLMPMFEALAALPAGPPDPAQVAAITERHGITFVR